MHSATLDNMEYRRHFIRIISLAGVPTQAKYTAEDEEEQLTQ